MPWLFVDQRTSFHRGCLRALGTHICVYNQPTRRFLLRPSFSFAVPVPCLLCAMANIMVALPVLVVVWTQENECNKPTSSKWWWLACMQQPRPAFNLYQLHYFSRHILSWLSTKKGILCLDRGVQRPNTLGCLVKLFRLVWLILSDEWFFFS